MCYYNLIEYSLHERRGWWLWHIIIIVLIKTRILVKRIFRLRIILQYFISQLLLLCHLYLITLFKAISHILCINQVHIFKRISLKTHQVIKAFLLTLHFSHSVVNKVLAILHKVILCTFLSVLKFRKLTLLYCFFKRTKYCWFLLL